MAEFIIGECKCGGSVLAEFGFSCSGKPKTSMRCDRCGKVSITIGNKNNPIKLWEGKYSTEYIDRRKLLKKITDIELIISLNRADYKTELIQAVKLYENAILKAILTEPSADVEEVRHGEWLLESRIYKMPDDVDEEFYVECPFCHRTFDVPFELEEEKMLTYAKEKYPYCNCGAKMDGKGD